MGKKLEFGSVRVMVRFKSGFGYCVSFGLGTWDWMYHISWVIRRNFFYFQNNPKDLDPSYKMDLDLWDRLGRVKLVL